MSKRAWGVFVVVAVFLASDNGVRGQSVTATLVGTVLDTTNALIPRARITLVEQRHQHRTGGGVQRAWRLHHS